MAQGSTKGLTAKTGSGGRKKGGTMRKGKYVIAPKGAQKISEKIHHKQLSSKINNSIEKQMVAAASIGKLTIMKNKGGDQVEPWVPLMMGTETRLMRQTLQRGGQGQEKQGQGQGIEVWKVEDEGGIWTED
ncbi:hypothetical protein P7C73_g4564, partial [Tremellales sp. Uapishka_1]